MLLETEVFFSSLFTYRCIGNPFYPCRTALAASDPGNRALHGCFSRHSDRFYPLVASKETGEALYPFNGGYRVSFVLQ